MDLDEAERMRLRALVDGVDEAAVRGSLGSVESGEPNGAPAAAGVGNLAFAGGFAASGG